MPKISDRHNPAHNIIPNPSLPGSSAKVICKNPCEKGWISYKGRCYKLIQERMTWTKAEVPGSSKQECSSFLLYFLQLSFLYQTLFSSLAAASVMYQCRPKECDIQLSAADEVSCTLPHHRTRCCNKLPPAWNLNLLELLFLMFLFLY